MDEKRWRKAKEIVQEQYGKTESDGDEYWKLVVGVYKQARGTIHKRGKGTYYYGKGRKRKLPPKARKSFIFVDINKGFKMPLPKGGEWKTIKGSKVYIKDGKIIAGAGGKIAGGDSKLAGDRGKITENDITRSMDAMEEVKMDLGNHDYSWDELDTDYHKFVRRHAYPGANIQSAKKAFANKFWYSKAVNLLDDEGLAKNDSFNELALSVARTYIEDKEIDKTIPGLPGEKHDLKWFGLLKEQMPEKADEILRCAQEKCLLSICSEWEGSVWKSLPLALQYAVSDVFPDISSPEYIPSTGEEDEEYVADLKAGQILRGKNLYNNHKLAFQALAKAKYNSTQKLLKKYGIKEMVVFRGMGYDEKTDRAGLDKLKWASGDMDREVKKPGLNDISFKARPLSSWTTDSDIAFRFLYDKDYKVVLVNKVPAKKIFSIARTGVGDESEDEVVLLGGKKDSVKYFAWEHKSKYSGKRISKHSMKHEFLNEFKKSLLKGFRTLPDGGFWRTIKGSKVYIKDGKIIAGARGKFERISMAEVKQTEKDMIRASFIDDRDYDYDSQDYHSFIKGVAIRRGLLSHVDVMKESDSYRREYAVICDLLKSGELEKNKDFTNLVLNMKVEARSGVLGKNIFYDISDIIYSHYGEFPDDIGHITAQKLHQLAEIYPAPEVKEKINEKIREAQMVFLWQVRKEWMLSNWTLEGIALQYAVSDLFGKEIGDPDYVPKDRGLESATLAYVLEAGKKVYEENAEGYKVLAKAKYEQTQNLLKKNDVQELVVFRGMGFYDLDDDMSQAVSWGDFDGGLKSTIFKSRPLSSWTCKRDVAFSFLAGDYKIVLVKKIPIENVFSINRTGMGDYEESEAVVLGGEFPVKYMAWDDEWVGYEKEVLKEEFEKYGLIKSLPLVLF